jgi:hypothetical protein
MTLPAIRADHEESQGPWPDDGHVCLRCWQRWPCDATRLLAVAEAAEALLAARDTWYAPAMREAEETLRAKLEAVE